jgi:hypothetical protein
MKFLINAQNVLNMNNGLDYQSTEYHKGGGGTTTTTSKMDPRLEQAAVDMLGMAKGAYKGGQLGGVAAINPLAQQALNQASGVAGKQDALAANMMAQANKGVDLSGMRTAATNEAQQALGINAAGAGRSGGLGGSRQALNQQSIANDLAGRFAGIDQQAQQQNMSMNQAAQAAQGTGLGTLGQVGQAQQDYNQQVADAPAKALSQYANAFKGASGGFGKTSTQTGGGGK